MKKVITYILLTVLTVATFVSCQKHYVKEYGLEVDAIEYTLPYTGSTFPLYIYCSGEWKVSFDEPVSWVRFENGVDSGTGTGLVHIEFDDNDDALRMVTVIVRSGSLEKTVTLTQKYNSTHLEIE